MNKLLPINQTLKLIEEAGKKDVVQVLRQHESTALLIILKMAYDNELEFDLPEGAPPFKKNEFDLDLRLHAEARKLQIWIKGNPAYANLSRPKKEQLFIDLLESIPEEEAQVLIALKDKKLKLSNVTLSTLKKAFPKSF